MRRRDKSELEQLVRTSNERIIRLTARRLGRREDAEDMAQDAYLRLLGRESREPIDNLPAFIGRSVRNLAIDLLRRRGRRNRVEGGSGDQAAIEAQPALGDPERDLIARQQLGLIRDAINALPPRCRQAFILHRFHGRNYEDIADTLGVSKSSVEKYIIRALEACRRKIL